MVAITKAEQKQNNDWQSEFEKLQNQQINADERLHWMIQLREVCDNYCLNESDASILFQLALRLCDWSMVLHIGELLTSNCLTASDNRKSCVASEQIAISLADAWIQIGLPGKAISTLRTALFSHYQNPDVFSFYRYAQNQHQIQNNASWPVEACLEQDLLITPLRDYHIESFRWIYSQYPQSKEHDEWQDQSVAQLCNLPRFENDQHWRDWLERHNADPKCFLFAVIHSEWGLIGSVSLEIFNGTGFFYYWLGEDFQGQGFGPKAVQMLLRMGEEYLGMQCCFAKVYNYNQPSQKALLKIGFERLPFKVAEPHASEWIYYLGPKRSINAKRNTLTRLFEDMASEIFLAEPEASKNT